MKIVITGGASGGHFVPLMAVSESIVRSAYEQKLLQPKIYYFGNSPKNPNMLWERGLVFERVPSAEMNSQFKTIGGFLKTVFGFFVAIYKLFRIYPDVVFVKGGLDGATTALAAYILQIPIIVHESDSVPGRVTTFLSKLAERVAVSYKGAAAYFKNGNIANTGQPIIEKCLAPEGYQKHYPTEKPTILITGGSQGSVRINNAIFAILPQLTEKYNVIHQCGEANYGTLKIESDVLLGKNNKDYTLAGSFNFSDIYPKVDFAVTRGGSTLFELAEWQIPSIVIPLPESYRDHQKENARAQEVIGWAKMLTEENLSPNILLSTIDNLLGDRSEYEKMANAAKEVNKYNAAKIIADEIIKISLSHH
jgi:UDP-N-acetylglucosamine--N-acetylmuramyl-(pentapeptide) pyrophosphoryl-undecaprenol N-acetylglucosamine transferase